MRLCCEAGPCRDLWGGRCSKYKRGTWNKAFNRAVLFADVCIEMDAFLLPLLITLDLYYYYYYYYCCCCYFYCC